MAKRSREADARSLRRRIGTRRPKKTLVIFCEGERTEPQYLEALKKQPEIRDAAAVDLRIETGHGKSLEAAKYMPLVATAARRAAELEARHQKNGAVFPHDNPSSGMHRLIASIQPA
jgi:hypothetical protein